MAYAKIQLSPCYRDELGVKHQIRVGDGEEIEEGNESNNSQQANGENHDRPFHEAPPTFGLQCVRRDQVAPL